MGLITEQMKVAFGIDNVVIRHYTSGIEGGKVLDVTSFTPDKIQAGHVIIYDTVNNKYKPMPLNDAGTAYGSLPSNHVYVGVSVASVLKKEPFVAIMNAGIVNDSATPFAMTSILSAFKTAVPTIIFNHD